jgi:hypothetical protein
MDLQAALERTLHGTVKPRMCLMGHAINCVIHSD